MRSLGRPKSRLAALVISRVALVSAATNRKASAPMPDLRLYLYCGEGDALEKELMGGMREMEGLLKERGFEEERNLKVSEDPAAAHNEESWAGHTDDWLLFLFGR